MSLSHFAYSWSRVLVVFLVLVLYGCRTQKADTYLYNNFDAEIYDLNGSANAFTPDKSHSATVINIATFRILDPRYPNAFFRLRGDDYAGPGCRILTDSFVYNHKPGDTVHFDFVGEHRVFHVLN